MNNTPCWKWNELVMWNADEEITNESDADRFGNLIREYRDTGSISGYFVAYDMNDVDDARADNSGDTDYSESGPELDEIDFSGLD